MADQIQTLGVVNRLFPRIVNGQKTSTIRWRDAHIVPGPLRFVCDGNVHQTIEVDLFRCTEIPLSEATSFVGMQDERPDQIMLDGMREHYPDIQLSSIVQITEHAPPVTM